MENYLFGYQSEHLEEGSQALTLVENKKLLLEETSF